MKIAVQNPMFSGMSGLHGYIAEFIRLHKPAIFVSRFKYLPRLIYFFWNFKINPLGVRLIFSKKKLNQKADVLICFNGKPYLETNQPIKEFRGLKIYHLMDYAYFPSKSHALLKEGDVDYVMGYNRHDIYCDFFKRFYPSYQGKVIAVPFGFASRFQNVTPFSERKDKVIALGAVRAFDEPENKAALQETEDFYIAKGEKFLHKFRRMLVEYEEELLPIMDSKLPHFPQVTDFQYDIVSAFNQYKMFTTCESLLYFPSVKTFEGIAAGSVMVCSEHPCFSDYGFEDGINCIKHKEFDLENFQEKVSFYLNNPNKLSEIQQRGTQFVRERYNHKKVAQNLYLKIQEVVGKENK